MPPIESRVVAVVVTPCIRSSAPGRGGTRGPFSAPLDVVELVFRRSPRPICCTRLVFEVASSTMCHLGKVTPVPMSAAPAMMSLHRSPSIVRGIKDGLQKGHHLRCTRTRCRRRRQRRQSVGCLPIAGPRRTRHRCTSASLHLTTATGPCPRDGSSPWGRCGAPCRRQTFSARPLQHRQRPQATERSPSAALP